MLTKQEAIEWLEKVLGETGARLKKYDDELGIEDSQDGYNEWANSNSRFEEALCFLRGENNSRDRREEKYVLEHLEDLIQIKEIIPQWPFHMTIGYPQGAEFGWWEQGPLSKKQRGFLKSKGYKYVAGCWMGCRYRVDSWVKTDLTPHQYRYSSLP